MVQTDSKRLKEVKVMKVKKKGLVSAGNTPDSDKKRKKGEVEGG